MKQRLSINTGKIQNLFFLILSISLLVTNSVIAQTIEGCMDNTAYNYDTDATVDDGSCCYEIGPDSCSDPCSPYNNGVSWSAGGAYCEDGGQNGEGPEYSCETGKTNNYSMNFDGIDDFLEIPLIDVSSQNQITIEVWTKPLELDEYHQIIRQDGSFFLMYENNSITFGLQLENDQLTQTSYSINLNDFLNTWTHLAVTYDGDTKYIYINGTLVTSEIINSGNLNFISNNPPLEIGRFGAGNPSQEYFNGYIDEVRIWDIALTETEISTYMNCPPTGNEVGLVGYWDFEENDINTVLDLSPNENNGTIDGATYDTETPGVLCINDGPNNSLQFISEQCDNKIWLQNFTIENPNCYLSKGIFHFDIYLETAPLSGFEIYLINKENNQVEDVLDINNTMIPEDVNNEGYYVISENTWSDDGNNVLFGPEGEYIIALLFVDMNGCTGFYSNSEEQHCIFPESTSNIYNTDQTGIWNISSNLSVTGKVFGVEEAQEEIYFEFEIDQPECKEDEGRVKITYVEGGGPIIDPNVDNINDYYVFEVNGNQQLFNTWSTGISIPEGLDANTPENQNNHLDIKVKATQGTNGGTQFLDDCFLQMVDTNFTIPSLLDDSLLIEHATCYEENDGKITIDFYNEDVIVEPTNTSTSWYTFEWYFCENETMELFGITNNAPYNPLYELINPDNPGYSPGNPYGGIQNSDNNDGGFWPDNMYGHGNKLFNVAGSVEGKCYAVVVTNTSNCVVGKWDISEDDGSNGTITVFQPELLEVTAEVTDPLCYGGNGSAALTIEGGVTPYTEEELSTLPAGTYNTTITDDNGCTAETELIVNQPGEISITLINSNLNLNCFDDDDGFLDIEITGGVGEYSYIWSNDETTEDIENLTVGDYTVTVTDGNDCIMSETFTINEPELLEISVDGNDVSCNLGSDGFGELTIIGGTPPYTTEDLTGLSIGTYSTIVTDDNGCSATTEFTINEPSEINLIIDVTNVSCNGLADGFVDLNITGGTPPYTTDDLIGLDVGTYTTTVIDDNGCEVTLPFIISEPEVLQISVETTDVLCNAGNDGSAIYTVTGGTQPYDIQDQFDLTAGEYTTTVTDDNGCTASVSFTINEPNIILPTLITSNSSLGCYGDSIGDIDINVTGGTGEYTYQWSNGETTQDVFNLTAGNYNLIITDDNNCSVDTNFTIVEPNEIIISLATSNSSLGCYGDTSGNIDIEVTGGSGEYTYQWSNGEITEDLFDLMAGNYNVIVTDQNNCSTESNFTINEPDEIIIILQEETSLLELPCYGMTGFIDIEVSGGTGEYTYQWSNGETTQDVTNLTPGETYNITIIDENGCPTDTSFSIIESNEILVTLDETSIIELSCFGDTTGMLNINVSGGTGEYTYQWSNGTLTQNINNLSFGTYEVTIIDSNECVAISSFNISEPENAVITVDDANSLLNLLCYGDLGNIDITVSGGTPPFSYLWSNGFTTQNINNIEAGEYTVFVTDFYDCVDSLNIEIVEPDGLPSVDDIQINQLLEECNGSCLGAINLDVSGGTPPYSFIWTLYNNTEDITLDTNGPFITGLCAGNYSVAVFDINGCSDFEADIIIGEPDPLELILTTVSEYNCNYNISCYNGENGSITTNAEGGSPNYTYDLILNNSIIDTNTDGIFNGLNQNNYSVIVTDSIGCSDTITDILLSGPDAPIIIENFDINDIATFCLNNGVISTSITGGCGLPYTYSLYSSDEMGNLETLQTQYTSNSNTTEINTIGEGWYTFIVSEDEAVFDLNVGGYDYNCEESVTFYMPETEAPNFDVFAEADITGIIIPDWSIGDTLLAPQSNIGIGSCESTISILNPDGILGDFGGSGFGYELYWFINDGDDPNSLDSEDTPLDQYNNQFNAEVDIQGQGQEFILLYLDLCPNGVIGDTVFITVPFMELNIEAESSITLFSSDENESAISCVGEEDAFASVQISGGAENDFNNASCLEDGNFWNVTWFLDDGDTEFNMFDTEITDAIFIEEDNLPILSGGDNIPDTYMIDSLAPGFYFAQIEDCLVEGCALIVEFDLRAEPEPIFLDVIIEQEDCLMEEEASACVQINGGTGPYDFILNMVDPNNPNDNIPLSLGNDGCISGEDLQPGLYSISATDTNECESDTINFEINLSNYIDSILVEVNLFSYPGGYNVSCNGQSDGIIENIVIYSLEDLDGDGNINTTQIADIDGDGVINTLDPNIDGDFYINTFDTDIDGDGILNGNDDTPIGIDIDDIIGTWDLENSSSEFTIDWGPWDPAALPAGDYSAMIYSLAANGVDSCGTEFSFSISEPTELYVFVPDYETCLNCPVNVSPEISGGQGPYQDIWTNLETGETLTSVINPDINPNEVNTIGVDYDLDDVNGFPQNILLLPGSYSLSIIDGNGCSPSEVTEFEVYEPSTELEWVNLIVSGCEPNTGQCGGIATIDINYELLNNQLCQIQWFNCEGETLQSSLESENMITDLCNGSYYVQLLYPLDDDVDGDGILNNEDDDMDNDGIPNFGPDGLLFTVNDNDPDIDGDGILNEDDSFPEGEFTISTLCFDYNDQGFDIILQDIQHDICLDEQNDGNFIDLSIEGGTGEFSVEWYNINGEMISTTQNLENINAGIYTVSVIDGSGCEMIEEFEVLSPEMITVDYNLSDFNGYNVPCAENAVTNQCGGIIDLNITGGIPFNPNSNFDPTENDFILPILDGDEYYQYTINNQINNISTSPQPLIINTIENNTIYATIENVCYGTNIIDIIADFDCVTTIEIVMTGPEELTFDITINDVSCPNAQDGFIEVECNGGVAPYNYEWSLNESLYSDNQNISDLNGGEYLLTISDLNDCLYDTIINVYEADEFEITSEHFQPQCNELLGWVDLNVTGGHIGNYQYNYQNVIYNFNPLDTLFLTTGEHEFIFIDSEGCVSDTILIDMDPITEDCLQIPTLFTPNGDSQNDVWQIDGIENYPEAKIRIYNRWGQLIFKSNNNYFGNEWDGTYNGNPLPFAVYYYTIDPINENGKTYNGGVTIKR